MESPKVQKVSHWLSKKHLFLRGGGTLARGPGRGLLDLFAAKKPEAPGPTCPSSTNAQVPGGRFACPSVTRGPVKSMVVEMVPLKGGY